MNYYRMERFYPFISRISKLKESMINHGLNLFTLKPNLTYEI